MPGAAKKSLTKRTITFVGQGILTLSVMAVAAATLAIGVSMLAERASAVPEPDAAAPTPVRVATIALENGYLVPRRFIGQVEASATVALSFELGGRLEDLMIREGDIVEKGQEIATLDTDLLEADAKRLAATRAAAAAQLTFAETRLARAARLQKQGFSSQETLDQARAVRDELINRIAETDATIESVAINIQKSALFAPFTGQIAAQKVDISQTVTAGQEVVTIMKTAQPELRVGLPLKLKPDDLKSVRAEIAGIKVSATLKRVRPDIDPVTRTRTALFAMDPMDPAVGLLFGQTAALILDTRMEQVGTWIALDALQSGKGSVWTVLIVENNRLRRAAVEILHVEAERAYVRGSFEEGMQYVTSGAHRVVPGQEVTVTGAES